MEMDLQINVRNDSKVPVIDLAGELDAYTSARFRETMIDLIDNGAGSLVVSMDHVEYIDSSGLATLVEILKNFRNYGGKLKLCNLSNKVQSLFEITKLEKLFDIKDTEEEAVKSF